METPKFKQPCPNNCFDGRCATCVARRERFLKAGLTRAVTLAIRARLGTADTARKAIAEIKSATGYPLGIMALQLSSTLRDAPRCVQDFIINGDPTKRQEAVATVVNGHANARRSAFRIVRESDPTLN
jgi:hypothetical protein